MVVEVYEPEALDAATRERAVDVFVTNASQYVELSKRSALLTPLAGVVDRRPRRTCESASVLAGRPVRGSIKWCWTAPAFDQRRLETDDVAMA